MPFLVHVWAPDVLGPRKFHEAERIVNRREVLNYDALRPPHLKDVHSPG